MQNEREERLMIILGIVIAGMAAYLIYALVYPEKL